MDKCGVCQTNNDCGVGLVCGQPPGFSGAGFCVPPNQTTECDYYPYQPNLANNWFYNYSLTIPVTATSTAPPDAGPPPDTGATTPDAGTVIAPALCTQFAAAECAKLFACFATGGAYTTEAQCRERVAIRCAVYMVGQADSAWTEPAINTCVTGIQAASCAEWNGSALNLSACTVRGQRPAGAGAFVDAQCASGTLERRTFNSCGFCQPLVSAGTACTADEQCPPQHACAPSGVCRPEVAEGQPCGADGPCQRALRCVNGICAKPGAAGQPCQQHSHCDRSAGLICNPVAMKCAPAVESDRCGTLNADGSVTVCRRGQSCASTGACMGQAADGQACVFEGDGPRCISPAVCLSGRCVLPTSAQCPSMRDPAGYPTGADPWCRVPGFPKYCAARGDQPANCWQAGADCATTTNCSGSPRSCRSPAQSYDCAQNACVPACTPPPGGNACDTCAATKCCSSLTTCRQDPSCPTRTGSNFTALETCLARFCPKECATTGPALP